MELNTSWYETLELSKDYNDDDDSNEDEDCAFDDIEEDNAPESPVAATHRNVHALREKKWKNFRDDLLHNHLEAQVDDDSHLCCCCDNKAEVICATCDFQRLCLACDAANHMNNTHRRYIYNDVNTRLLQPGGLLLNGTANYLSVHPPSWFEHCRKLNHPVSKMNIRPSLVTLMDLSGICNVILPVFCCNRCNLTTSCNVELLQKSGYWFSNPNSKTWYRGRKLIVYDTRVFDLLSALRSTSTGLSASNYVKAISSYMRSGRSTIPTDISNATFHQAYNEYCLLKLRASKATNDCFDRCEVCVKKCNGISVDGLKSLIRYDRYVDQNDASLVNYFSCTPLAVEMENVFAATHQKSNVAAQPDRCYSVKLGVAVASNQGFGTVKKNSKLDETGLICAVCKHNVAHAYCDMNKGEKYGRVCAVLSSALKKISTPHVIYYDNMCILKKTIEIQLRHNPDNKELAMLSAIPRKLVPTFHVNTHDIYCKMSNSPQYCEGAGANTGEICEVNNAKAAQLSRITKMANKANRQEQIEVMFYNMNTLQRWNLSSFICKQLRCYTREKDHLETLFDPNDAATLTEFNQLETAVISYIRNLKCDAILKLNNAGAYIEKLLQHEDNKATLSAVNAAKRLALKDVPARQLKAVGAENYIKVVGGNLLNAIEELDLEVKYLSTTIGSARGSNHRGTIREKARKKRANIADLETKYNEVVALADKFNISPPIGKITANQGYAQIKGNPDALKTLECIIGFTRWKRVKEEIQYLNEELQNLIISRHDRYKHCLENYRFTKAAVDAICVSQLRPIIFNDISVLKSFKHDASVLENLFV